MAPSEVREFVGQCSYYQRFVKDFSAHLTSLLERTAECDASFNHLKVVLSSAPIMILLDFNVPFKIYSDASKRTVGAVLAQDKDGLEHVVAYASRVLNLTQRHWSTCDRELWTTVWAVRQIQTLYWICFIYYHHRLSTTLGTLAYVH